jgi:ariadne-1
MEEMQVTSNLTWIEVQFARKAVDEIIKCRMTLKWTYSMAYYLLDKDNQKYIFEDIQACVFIIDSQSINNKSRRSSDLEKAVEDLSELLEQPIEPETINTLRQKMTDKTVRGVSFHPVTKLY